MEKTLEEKVKEFKKELDPLLKKHSLKIGAVPLFPQYNILPEEVQLALKILEKNSVQYHVGFQEVNNANKS